MPLLTPSMITWSYSTCAARLAICGAAAAQRLCCVSYAQAAKHLSSAFHRRKVVQQGRLKNKLWLMMIFICNFQLVKITLMHLASLPITGLTRKRPWRIISDVRALAPRVQPQSSFADCSHVQGNNFMTLTQLGPLLYKHQFCNIWLQMENPATLIADCSVCYMYSLQKQGSG